jgi:hypothetical protein
MEQVEEAKRVLDQALVLPDDTEVTSAEDDDERN